MLRRSLWARLWVAPLSVATAWALRTVIAPVLGEPQHVFLALPASVMVSVLCGGVVPGMLATVLAVPVLLSTMGTLGLTDQAAVVRVAFFVAESGLITVLGGWFRETVRRTEAARAEAARQRALVVEREARLHAILDTAPDGIVTVDEYDVIESLNPAAARLFGYTAGELIGENLRRIVPVSLREEYARLRAASGETPLGSNAHQEVLGCRRDGTTVPLVLAVSELCVGARRLFTGILHDVSERVRSEQRFRRAIEAAPNAMIMVNADGTITFANVQAARLFGYAQEELVGSSVECLVPDRLRARHVGERTAFMRAPETRAMGVGRDLYARHRDGHEIPVEIGLNPLMTPEGMCVLGSVIDISEHRRVAEQLQEGNRRKDAFLGMLSHELRNPLAALTNALHLVRIGAQRDAAIALAERQVERLRHMVDDLLDVSRITRGRLVLQKQVVSLQEIVDAAVRVVQPLVADRGSEVAVVAPEAALWVDGDRMRLEQVVGNLLDNAIKYAGGGGRITVTLEADDATALVRVRDTGMGIAAADLPHVFEPFTQADRSLDHAGGGLGIGLTVVRSLVELHGGTVTASSDGPGTGSEFVVRLVRVDAHRRAVSAADAARSSGLPVVSERALQVLVVDDNFEFVDSLRPVLELMGHEVCVASDGPAALESATHTAPDVVLLDIGLPGMDGYEVARHLRQRRELERTVMIALSGYGRAEDRLRAIEAGFHHHLLKPVDVDALQVLLRRASSHGNRVSA